jgi:transcriptional regulator with PAS, ATPase and Fis domain
VALHLTLEDFHTEDAVMAACLQRARAAAATDLPVLTGAEGRLKGKFELAHGGTLFIDEIADMSPSAQSKILRVVEYGEFERLGSESLQTADVRVISATHYPRENFHDANGFRRDLFFRISGIILTVPPLRERPRDLPLLVAAEIARAARKHRKSIMGLERLAADRLFSYAWPGNLRELSKVLEAAVALARTDMIESDALTLDMPGSACPAGGIEPRDAAVLTLAEVERRHILEVLDRFGGNKRRAARVLGVSRSRLDRKLALSPSRADEDA